LSVLSAIPLIEADPPIDSYPALYVPQSLHLRLSGECNLSCSFCERESWKRGDLEPEPDMGIEVWDRVKSGYLEGIRGIELSGLGEPTMHRQFPIISQEIVQAGKTLYFPTNATTLGSRRIIEATGVTPVVSISLDAWDEESYKRMRGGNWSHVTKNIKMFSRSKPMAHLHSQFTASTQNIDGLPQFIEVCADLGIRDVLMRFVANHTQAREDFSLVFARDRTEKAIDAARVIAEREGVWFMAERRRYSAQNPDTAERTDPLSRLRRYLDFNILDEGDPMSMVCFPFDTGYSGSGLSGGSTMSSTGSIAPEGGGAIGEPIIIRSPRRPRDDPGNRVFVHAPASLIVAANGELWTCFARHIVGNVFQDDLYSMVTSPRYQAFLQRRFSANDMAKEANCRGCARVF